MKVNVFDRIDHSVACMIIHRLLTVVIVPTGISHGHIAVVLDNLAYFKAQVSLLGRGFEYSFLDAQLCYISRLEYSFDIFQVKTQNFRE